MLCILSKMRKASIQTLSPKLSDQYDDEIHYKISGPVSSSLGDSIIKSTTFKSEVYFLKAKSGLMNLVMIHIATVESRFLQCGYHIPQICYDNVRENIPRELLDHGV